MGKGGKAPRHAGGVGRVSGAAQSPARLQSDGQPSPKPSPATSGEGKRHPCLSRHRGSGPALTGAAGPSAPAMSSPGLGPAPGRARGQSRGLHVCISRCAVLTPREELPSGGDAGEIPSSSRQSGPITVPGAPAAPPPSSSGTEDPSLALVYTAENNQGQRKGFYSGLIILFYFSLVYFILFYSILWYFILFTKGTPVFQVRLILLDISVLEPRASLKRRNKAVAPLLTPLGCPPLWNRGQQLLGSPVDKAGPEQPSAARVFSGEAGKAGDTDKFLPLKSSFFSQLGGEFAQCPAPPGRPGRPSAALPGRGLPSLRGPASQTGCGTRDAAFG